MAKKKGLSSLEKKILAIKWRPVLINGQESNYEVSETGFIRNVKTNQMLKSFPDKQGYLRLTLCKDGIQYTRKVHRLVAEAFIPNPENKPEVNHKDGNKANNAVSNLEWVTPKENIIHAVKTGLTDNRAIGERVGTSKYSDNQIHLVCKLLEDVQRGYSSISEVTNVSYDVIAKIATGKLWNHISKDYNIPNRSKLKYPKLDNTKLQRSSLRSIRNE